MLYEYELNPDVSKEDIKNMLLKSKVLRRNWFNLNVLMWFIITVIILLISVVIVSFITDAAIVFIEFFCIGAVVFMMSIIYGMLVLHKNREDVYIIKLVQNNWKEKRYIEVREDMYVYIRGDFKTGFIKKVVMEILKFDEYTFIFVRSKYFKNFLSLEPIILPNNLFESEEKYNEFINMIS